ncbi:MAG TPA: TIGR03118 family protein, partial [Jatrophihabitans sp.]|nr:TIGR03118 family protein [Jatrophihabitans sp.]
VLNSPWALTVAPTGFGDFSGDVLIGNFGDGTIHAFDRHGKLAGTLRDTHGRPLAIDGLWALKPGNGVSGATSDVWFSAGPDGESHGLLGILHSADDD